MCGHMKTLLIRERRAVNIELKIKQRDSFSPGGARLVMKLLLHGDTFKGFSVINSLCSVCEANLARP